MTDARLQFLRARLDEDERIARGHQQWSPSWHQDDCVNEIHDDENAGTVATVYRLGDRTHIARHDPARVLAEVDAKRRLVDEMAGVLGGDWIDAGEPVLAERVLLLLALPYADHPDYREEWKP